MLFAFSVVFLMVSSFVAGLLNLLFAALDISLRPRSAHVAIALLNLQVALAGLLLWVSRR